MDVAKSDTRVSFGVLGPLEVHDGGGRLEIGGRRLRALLASLLLDPGRTVPFGVLVEGVWGADPPSGVGNALQALVSRLRGALGRDTVAAESSGYRLVASPEQVDAHRFARLAADGRTALDRGAAAEAARTLAEALSLWRGAALADVTGTGAADAAIARLEGLRLAALEDRIDADLLLGRYADVAGELAPLISAHPLRERLRGQLMRALYGAGRRVEALAAYQTARGDFAELLGTDPSPGLVAIHVSILRGSLPPAREGADETATPTWASDAPGDGAWKDRGTASRARAGDGPAPVRRTGNLRARLTSFVGREEDMEYARSLLAEHRLVTLLGPGGAGKTRLAVESGETLLDRMPDGVWLAELAPVRDPGGVPQAVLAALGMRDTQRAPVLPPGTTPEMADATARLVAGLAARRQLIILDNCEHLIEEAARLADRILAECPGVRILATSREPLGITGELLWPVRPLDHEHAKNLFADRAAMVRPGHAARPSRRNDDLAVTFVPGSRAGSGGQGVQDRGGDGRGTGTGHGAGKTGRYGSVEHDRRAEGETELHQGGEADRRTLDGDGDGDGDGEVVARICRELDGMPLAIELAAARLRTLSASQIADRLDDRFRLLTGGSRTALPRHQTLRAVVEWSWDLLDERERVLARRFANFAGGATLKAVETVCSGGVLPAEDVLEVLARLVDKSFVVSENERYRMLETIRAYAVERLVESGEEQAVRMAYARFFTGLAETAEPELRRRDQVTWLAVLSAEHDNLTTALRQVTEAGDRAMALRLVGALGWYWFLAGRRAEGAQRASEAIALAGSTTTPASSAFAGTPPTPGADDSPRTLALALTVGGLLTAGGTNLWREARDMLEQAVSLARCSVPRPWPPVVSLAEPLLAFFSEVAPEPETFPADLFEDPDDWVVGCAHLLRAHVYYGAGQIVKGEEDVRVALDRFRTLGDRWGIGTAMASLAEVSTLRGDNATTIVILEEAIALVDEIGAVEDTPFMRTRLAMAMNALGDRAGAERMLEQALEICHASADRMGEAGVLTVRGDLAREHGELGLARWYYDEVIGIAASEMMDFPGQFRAMLQSSVGLLAEQEGDLRAARDAHAEALRLVRDSRDGAAFGLILIARAGLAVREGDAAKSAALLGAAALARGIDEVVGYDHVRITEATTAALGPEEYTRCFEHGRSMAREEIDALSEEIAEG